jgi:hypothetical protein
MASPTEESFCVVEHAEKNHAPLFRGPSRNGFIMIHLLEHRHRDGLATLKTRAAFVRSKAVTVLVRVKRLYGRWRPPSIEVQ